MTAAQNLRISGIRSLALAAIIVGSLAGLMLAPDSGVGVQTIDNGRTDLLPRPIDQRQWRYVGTHSCSASGCHSSRDNTSGSLGREHDIWIENDPHSRAFSTLFSERSVQIAENLGLDHPPHTDSTCLACHTTATAASPTVQLDTNWQADGVGCESCHGPAEAWLQTHTRSDWKFWTVESKAAAGFVDGTDLLSRTENCVKCHVGSAGRDVNHDLVAAGHPRLYFEMTAYQANLPRHWSREKDKLENGRAFEAKLWAIGQAVSAAAATGLLVERAESKGAAWPEFAEYDCFACHREIAPESLEKWRRSEDYQPGRLPWAAWHTAMLRSLEFEPATEAASKLESLMRGLGREMAESFPDRSRIAGTAKSLSQLQNQVAISLSEANISPVEIKNQLILLTKSASQANSDNWEAATQRFLAVAALRQALVDLNSVDDADHGLIRRELDEIRNRLIFTDGHDSPMGFDQKQLDAIAESLERIRMVLEGQ